MFQCGCHPVFSHINSCLEFSHQTSSDNVAVKTFILLVSKVSFIHERKICLPLSVAAISFGEFVLFPYVCRFCSWGESKKKIQSFIRALNNRLISYKCIHFESDSGVTEPTRLDTATPYRKNVAICSLLKFNRSYLNSWCRKVSQRYLISSCGDGTRLCLLLFTLIQVPGGTLISVMCCVQILVLLSTPSPLDFGTICWMRLRQAFCVMFSSLQQSETQKEVNW